MIRLLGQLGYQNGLQLLGILPLPTEHGHGAGCEWEARGGGTRLFQPLVTALPWRMAALLGGWGGGVGMVANFPSVYLVSIVGDRGV